MKNRKKEEEKKKKLKPHWSWCQKKSTLKLTESESGLKGGGALRIKTLFNCYIIYLHVMSM